MWFFKNIDIAKIKGPVLRNIYLRLKGDTNVEWYWKHQRSYQRGFMKSVFSKDHRKSKFLTNFYSRIKNAQNVDILRIFFRHQI